MSKSALIATAAACASMSLLALWLGSYYMNLWGMADWRGFPTFFTALAVFIGGAVGAIICGVSASEAK